MIRELVNKCFESNGFESEDLDFDSDFSWQSFIVRRKETHGKQEFFVVIDKNDAGENDLMALKSEGILDIYDSIKRHSFYNDVFGKNASLIICYNGETPESNIIPDIEEDPYIFKKSVLIYSNQELEDLESLLKDGGCYSIEALNKILIDTDKFQEMKKRKQDQQTGYDLLVRLFVKLSFLTLGVGNQKKLDNLDKEIKTHLNKKSLLDFCDEVLDTDWENINSYDQLPENLKSYKRGESD